MAVTEQKKNVALVSRLKSLGFTEYEARVYLCLIESPPSTAYEIAKFSGVPRPNTYSALSALAERGAARPVSEKPCRYVAQGPERLFRAIASDTRLICDSLAEELNALTTAPSDQYVWNIEGEAAVHEKVTELIAKAESEIWLKADTDTLRAHAEELRGAAIDRGLSILIILFGSEEDEFRFTERCKVHVHEATGVRMGTADNLFTVVIDQNEMLTANEEGGPVRGAMTENKAIVKMALSLIRHDFYMAEICSRFGKEIYAEFGPFLQELRTESFTPEQLRSFKERTGLA